MQKGPLVQERETYRDRRCESLCGGCTFGIQAMANQVHSNQLNRLVRMMKNVMTMRRPRPVHTWTARRHRSCATRSSCAADTYWTLTKLRRCTKAVDTCRELSTRDRGE